jgi:hypothetical protein
MDKAIGYFHHQLEEQVMVTFMRLRSVIGWHAIVRDGVQIGDSITLSSEEPTVEELLSSLTKLAEQCGTGVGDFMYGEGSRNARKHAKEYAKRLTFIVSIELGIKPQS